ncbi:MAG: flagellin, partial [Nitrospirae bacterium]|nr:flagellin [Nitrospirota bacterium]
MALNINTNTLSLNAQRNLSLLQPALQSAMQRLSSGLRINSSADDAAGLAISTRMGAQINGLNTSVNNVNNGIAEAQTADSALNQTSNLMQTMRELAVESANATNTNIDRQSLQAEVAQLQQEVSRIAATTTFNNQIILNGSQQNVAYQVGANAGQTVALSIGDARASSIGGDLAFTNNGTNGMGQASSFNRFATDGAAAGKCLPIHTNNYGAQTLKITNAAGTTIENGAVAVAANEQASDIATSLNRLQGVNATAYNQI